MKDRSLYGISKMFAGIRYLYVSLLMVIASVYCVSMDVSFHLFLFLPTMFVCAVGVYSVRTDSVLLEKAVCKTLLITILFFIIGNIYLFFRLHSFITTVLLIVEAGAFLTLLNRYFDIDYLIKQAKKVKEHGIE